MSICMNVRHTLSLLAGSFMLAASASACISSGNGDAAGIDIDALQGSALFDNFTYAGNDSYYNEHPLQSESEFYNPILSGFYPDPSICSNGKGDYYLVCSSFTYFPGVPIFHSRDLVNWKQVGHVLDRESQMLNMIGQHISGGIFAPAISYDAKTETYYMITTNVGAGNFYVKTQDPAGDWSDPIPLPAVRGIDPSIFIDDDGRAYVINNDDAPENKPEYPGHRTVRMIELDLKAEKTIGERRILINKGCRPEEKPIWCEAPHIYKIGGTYYLMTAEGGTSDWHSEVIYRSNHVWGPYEPYVGNPILTQRTLDNNRPDPITCAGHADLVQAVEGDWWAVFLACRPIEANYENLGRETFLLPVTWTEDGWPIICKNGELVDRIVSRPGVKREADVTFGNFSLAYDFDQPELDQRWMTLRTAGRSNYSLTDQPGYLRLQKDSATLAQRVTPSLLCHRISHHAFETSTKMVYRPQAVGDLAGMVLFKDERNHVIFGVTLDEQEQRVLTVQEVVKNSVRTLASLPVDRDVLSLRISSDGYKFSFAAEIGGEIVPLDATVPAAYLSTRDAGGFCGTTIGLYCTGK